MSNLTALHDQAEAACRDELALLAETYRLLAARHGDAQATADLVVMLQERGPIDLGLVLAFAVREAARGAAEPETEAVR